MPRLDVRSDCQVPVTIFLDSPSAATSYEAVTANLGLRGAFVNLPLPEQAKVKLKARFNGFDGLEIEGEVVRTQKEGTALRFVKVPDDARPHLWDHIRKSLNGESLCPYCGNGNRNGTPACEQCGRSIDFTAASSLATHETEVASRCTNTLEKRLSQFNSRLEEIESQFLANPADEEALLRETSEVIYGVCSLCQSIEETLADAPETIKRLQVELRTRTNEHFSKSYFMNRARTWPQGYPGDYKLIESVYRNTPLSDGLGHLLDLHFLSTALGTAVRERRKKMEEILRGALVHREKPRTLNIACGPCREVVALAPEIEYSGAMMTCVDFDSDALDFAMKRLAYTDVLQQVSFRKYNALRMVSYERNLKEFGRQDIIYSMGFFDYVKDDIIIRMLNACYSLLNPHGMLIAPFKDCGRYGTQEYHWFVDWDAFYQRTDEESRALFAEAGIPDSELTAVRDGSGVIIFYVVSKG
jgi:hypothetical protein